MARDRVFARKRRQIQPFSFNREVAEVFDDMLVRSVFEKEKNAGIRSLTAIDRLDPVTGKVGCVHKTGACTRGK